MLDGCGSAMTKFQEKQKWKPSICCNAFAEISAYSRRMLCWTILYASIDSLEVARLGKPNDDPREKRVETPYLYHVISNFLLFYSLNVYEKFSQKYLAFGA